jgi:hypothetical protein
MATEHADKAMPPVSEAAPRQQLVFNGPQCSRQDQLSRKNDPMPCCCVNPGMPPAADAAVATPLSPARRRPPPTSEAEELALTAPHAEVGAQLSSGAVFDVQRHE